MNPRDPKQFTSLVDAVKESRRKLEPFRQKRTDLISLFCGSDYSDDAEVRRTYVNLMALATNIYVRQLAARAPTARVVTPFAELRPTATDFTLACKDASIESDLGTVFRRCATDALFSPMSTVKVGLRRKGEVEIKDGKIEVTEPFVDLVSFDDYVRDMSARSAYKPAFEGDTYYMTVEEVHARYPQTKSWGLTKDELNYHDDQGTERAERLAHRPYTGDEHATNDKVAVQDLYLYKEKLLVTYLVNHDNKPLEVKEWDGSGKGPYFSLWFSDVPDNAMPLPPFSLLRNLHELANSIFRRLAHQAKVQKRVVGFSDEESAQRFGKCRDGDAIRWDGQKPEAINTGGIDQPQMAMFLQVKDLFSWSAGNLDSLGGLSAISETAKQDQLVTQSANAQIASMQDATVEFAQSVFREIAWYEWTDPVRGRILEKRIPGTDMSIAVPWMSETRKGRFLDYNFMILPQSMQDENPAAKIGKINNIMMQLIIPMMPMFESQGYVLDTKQWIAMIADYSNLPELEKILVATDTPPGGPDLSDDSQPIPKPTSTHRTYERINRPGATRSGKDAALAQTLSGAKQQPADQQAATMGVT
jgi:hypothetical protein